MEKRKNYFIDKQFQTKFILKFCLINMAASLMIGTLIYALNRQTNTVAFENLKVVVKSTADFIGPVMSWVIVMVTAAAAISTMIIVLFTSHRIAGPLFRLTREFEKIKKKDLSHPIRIRATDQLQRLASESEAMRVEYQESLGKIQKSWQALRILLLQQSQEIKDAQQKRQLEQEMNALTSELELFRTQ